jgi:hypothetical protein
MDRLSSISAGLPDFKSETYAMAADKPATNGKHGSSGKQYSGLDLKQLLWGKTPEEHARVAAYLKQINASYVDLSASQHARLCEANPGSVSVALGNGGTRGPHLQTIDRCLNGLGPSLNQLLEKYGREVLLRALDRYRASKPDAELGRDDHPCSGRHDHRDDHRHHNGGDPIPAPASFTFELELVDSPEGRQDFVKRLFRQLDAERAQAERMQPTELPGLVAAE